MRLRVLSIFFVVLCAISSFAQSTQPDLQARLLHKPLYLRGLWHDDNLKFDASGALLAPSAPFPFTLSGIEITKVQLKPNRLLLIGRRIGLTFKGATPQRVTLTDNGSDEVIYIELAAPAAGDYGPALDGIFTEDLSDLIPHMPTQWQNFATKNLVRNAVPATPATEQPKSVPPARRVGGGVVPPRILSSREPEFNNYARGLKINGTCLVYLQVGEDGKVSHTSIVRPIGLGLDEGAIVAVQAYKFSPATENGKPVTVELNVEVNFQIH